MRQGGYRLGLRTERFAFEAFGEQPRRAENRGRRTVPALRREGETEILNGARTRSSHRQEADAATAAVRDGYREVGKRDTEIANYSQLL